ncbi:MAG: MerR family transcriptional regulator [Oculatellaceae cyanobacterium Prado106]|nr:MerR family transcriptional regulator [Oculatellaceae cyanobacterium Prado106]
MEKANWLINRFTRQETARLTGCTPSHLAYLEKVGLITPHRVKDGSRQPFFSWDQLLEIRAIKSLRQRLSLQSVRKIVNFFTQHGYSYSLRDKQIVVVGYEAFWINPEPSEFSSVFPSVIQVMGREEPQISQYHFITLSLSTSIRREMWRLAHNRSNVIELEQFRDRG